jgi:hypothetical protein
MWEDSSTEAVRNVGTHAQNAEYTAFFLLNNDAVTLTVDSYPALSGTFQYRLSGTSTWANHTGPILLNEGDSIDVRPVAEPGYEFRVWEDLSQNALRTLTVDTNMTITEYFLATDAAERATITLTSSPSGAGTFSWQLPGMTSSVGYAGPFEVNKADDLTVTAVAERTHAFLMWEDSSTAAVRNIGTHTADTAEYTATFEALPVHRITAIAGPGGSISPSGTVNVIHGESQAFTFTPNSGYTVSAVHIDGTKMPEISGSYTFQHVITDHEIRVEFSTAQITTKYYVTATSDEMTYISPEGTVAVNIGASKTFYFSAAEGYRVDAVTVDGTLLPQADIDKGYYTFSNVRSDHAIRVTGVTVQAVDMMLEIDISKGGYAEYSVNGGPFQRYVLPIMLHNCVEITLRAYADDGYRFLKWETPDVYTTPEITLDSVNGTLYLNLFFSSTCCDAICILVAIILIAAIAFLLWFFFFRRKTPSS